MDYAKQAQKAGIEYVRSGFWAIVATLTFFTFLVLYIKEGVPDGWIVLMTLIVSAYFVGLTLTQYASYRWCTRRAKLDQLDGKK